MTKQFSAQKIALIALFIVINIVGVAIWPFIHGYQFI